MLPLGERKSYPFPLIKGVIIFHAGPQTAHILLIPERAHYKRSTTVLAQLSFSRIQEKDKYLGATIWTVRALISRPSAYDRIHSKGCFLTKNLLLFCSSAWSTLSKLESMILRTSFLAQSIMDCLIIFRIFLRILAVNLTLF